jgi:hypothetical protein
MKLFRHGDVLLKQVEKIPKGLSRKKDNILVDGEVTGHAHRLMGADIMIDAEKMFFEVVDSAKVTHEEHKTIELPKGKYEVIRQREYNPSGNRKVHD